MRVPCSDKNCGMDAAVTHQDVPFCVAHYRDAVQPRRAERAS